MTKQIERAENSTGLMGIATSRRQFIKVSTAASGGLSLGLGLTACSTLTQNRFDEQGNWEANAWLEISPSNAVTFTLDRVEMGQGTYTGLTTLIAEELDIEPSEINIVFAPVAKVYRNPEYGMQITGGSNSLSSSWEQIREAGAVARTMLVAAAAEVLQVPADYLKTDSAQVLHPASGKALDYGSLAKLASKQEIPSEPKLKDPKEFRYIGKQNKRLDSQLKVTGQAGYGIDVDIDGMRFAVVKRCPYIGGALHLIIVMRH